MDNPELVVLAGPNGAGKTTVGTQLMMDKFRIDSFVNADDIARGLNVMAPEQTALEAGRAMLSRLKELAEQRVDFGFETTLASRTFAPWLTGLIQNGYQFHLVYFWLSSPELAIRRVADRVSRGGHHVPDAIVRRRYTRGIVNFFELYEPLAHSWRVYDASAPTRPRLVAEKHSDAQPAILIESVWKRMVEVSHG